MATSPPVVQGSPASEPAKLSLVSLLIAVVVGVVFATMGVGGIFYFLVRSGRLPVQGGATVRHEPAAPVATHSMVLEPLLVNLADGGGNAYLRVGLTLRVVDGMNNGGTKPNDEKRGDRKGGKDVEAVAAVRDTALMVLGRQTSEVLLAEDGKERLKSELKAAIAEHDTDLKITDLYFTEFLVQR